MAVFRQLPEANLKFREVGRYAKFRPSSCGEAAHDREIIAYLPRQRFQVVRDFQRLYRVPEIAMFDADLETVGSAATEGFLIRPVVHREDRLRPPL